MGLDYAKYLEIDPSLCRPAEVDYLRGRNTKANNVLNWSPEIDFNTLIKDMVDNDIGTVSNV